MSSIPKPDPPAAAAPTPAQQRVASFSAQQRELALAGIVYQCVGDVEAEAVDWLWPGRIPTGELTMIVGDPGLGKSQICASLASVVTNGGQWPVTREQCTRGSVLILSAEDNIRHTIRPRLDAAGADVRRCHALQAVKRPTASGTLYDATFSLASDLVKLSVLMDHIGDVRLVIVDPVSAYLGETDSHKNAEVRGLLAPLTTLAGRHGAALVLVSHLTKSQSVNALMRVQGSVAFSGVCRAVWGVVMDKEAPERRLFMPLKNNLGEDRTGFAYSIQGHTIEGVRGQPIATSRVLWETEPVTMGRDEAFGAALPPEEHSELADARDFLQKMLTEGRMPVKEIQQAAKTMGHSINTLGRAKRALHVQSIPEGFGDKRVWWWALPAPTPST